MKDSYSITKEKGRQGLCTFCDVAISCALIGASGMPVLECEEFRVWPQGKAIQENHVGTKSFETTQSERKNHTDRAKHGLCGSCAIYDTCTYSKAEGGIWHCEDYR